MGESLFVAGPMHPDLFGGETPVMVPMPGQLYRFKAEWEDVTVEIVGREGYVHAMNDSAAENAIERMWGEKWAHEAESQNLDIQLEQVGAGEVTLELLEDAINAMPEHKDAA